MSTPALAFHGATKAYGRGSRQVVALDHLDLVVEAGELLGLLGVNGSGKTTALKAAVGLIRLDGGSVQVLGQPAPDGLRAVVHRYGALVDAPRFFGDFTARQRLVLLATDRGLAPARVEEVLAVVGLSPRAGDLIRTFSLGMRQRLGVATALLGSPELLILDEPVNGMDPVGLRDMRDLFRTLHRAGVTVVISSHMLSEVEDLCTSVAVFSGGRVVHRGSVEDLRQGSETPCAVVRIDATAEAASALAAAGWSVQHEAGTVLRVELADRTTADISRCLAAAGLFPTEITPTRRSLTSAFLELVHPDERTPDEPGR